MFIFVKYVLLCGMGIFLESATAHLYSMRYRALYIISAFEMYTVYLTLLYESHSIQRMGGLPGVLNFDETWPHTLY